MPKTSDDTRIAAPESHNGPKSSSQRERRARTRTQVATISERKDARHMYARPVSKKSMLAFRAYCRTLMQGRGIVATSASMAYQSGGKTPSECKKRLYRLLEQNRIEEDSYLIRVEAVDETARRWMEGSDTHIDPCLAEGGWDSLGENRHVRKTFRPGVNTGDLARALDG